MIHESVILHSSAQIGINTSIWHFSHVREFVRIGDNCSIGQNCYVGPGVVVGNGCRIQNNVSLYEGVELGDGVFCGPSCVFTNDLSPRTPMFAAKEFVPVKTLIGTGVSIGANATIVCGIKIGPFAMIAAGAVVTSDVAPHSLVAGVPARHRKTICRCGLPVDEAGWCQRCNRHTRSEDPGALVAKGGE